MTELIDFIPRTSVECEALLGRIASAEGPVALTDRRGRTQTLDPAELASLASLVAAQIGRPAPRKKNPKKQTRKK